MITTKTGDDGKSRWSGKTIDKDGELLEAVGTLDELQAVVEDEDIQKDLHGVMGELTYHEKITNCELRIANVEKEIKKLESILKPTNKFLTFKNENARKLNWARTICRRAERRLVSLSKVQRVDKNILIYINRLSDYLFMLSRQEEE